MTGSLFVVATPIGNLEDLTLRAIRILGEADIIAAENSRMASKILRKINVSPTVVPYNDRNKRHTTKRIISYLRNNKSVALISDAGTPGISDPGADLVNEAISIGAQVIPIPGASAVTTLISIAGIPIRTVRIVGFFPKKIGDLHRLLNTISSQGYPILGFESPRRIQKNLKTQIEIMPKAHIIIGRELTKLHEEIWRGSPENGLKHFQNPKGEFSLLIIPPIPELKKWSDENVRSALLSEKQAGESRRQASALIAFQSGRSRREVYALWPK